MPVLRHFFSGSTVVVLCVGGRVGVVWSLSACGLGCVLCGGVAGSHQPRHVHVRHHLTHTCTAQQSSIEKMIARG